MAGVRIAETLDGIPFWCKSTDVTLGVVDSDGVQTYNIALNETLSADDTGRTCFAIDTTAVYGWYVNAWYEL